MRYRLPIESRLGNLLLMGVGLLFLVAGLATLVYAIVSTWGYAGLTERLMQLVLVACTLFGAVLVLGARRNLTRAGGPSHHAHA